MTIFGELLLCLATTGRWCCQLNSAVH